MLATAVHTTGVNIDGLVANVASLTVVIGAFGAVLLKLINRSIEDKIKIIVREAVAEVRTEIDAHQVILDAHAVAIAKLEGIQVGKRLALDEMAQSSKVNP